MEAIRRELNNIPNPKVRTTCETYLQKIDGGERDSGSLQEKRNMKK